MSAPQRRGAEESDRSGTNPNSPSAAMKPVIGTISATVIQSSPSMKLTRFTNQTPPNNEKGRSTMSGTASGNDANLASVKRRPDRQTTWRSEPWPRGQGPDVVDRRRQDRAPRGHRDDQQQAWKR